MGRPQRTLILGGGIGGIATANRLRRRTGKRHEIVLVNREPIFSLAASYLWVMTGHRRPSQISRPLTRLSRRGIDVRIGEVGEIHAETRSAVVDGRSIEADNLVIALGADWATDAVPGLVEHGNTFTTLPGATRLARQLQLCEQGRILIVTAAPLYKCPAAPYEAALLIDALMRRTGRRGRVSIAVHAAEPGPMGTAGPTVSAAVKHMLGERGIEYRPDHQLAEVRPEQALFADGDVKPFDLLVYMPGIKPPGALTDSGVTDGAGWATANRNTLSTTAAGVWAIGDNTNIPLGIGKPLPRAGVFAHAQAHVVADAIADQAAGRPASGAGFDGRGGCFIEVGHGRAGFGSGDFYAEPSPAVTMKPPARHWHLAKAAFEKNVMYRWL